MKKTVENVSIYQLIEKLQLWLIFPYIKLHSSTLLRQIGISCSNHYLIDIFSDWAANALQVYKGQHR